MLLNQIRLDLRYTPDPVEQSLRVIKALLVFGWMVIEALHHDIAKQNRRCQNMSGTHDLYFRAHTVPLEPTAR